MLRRPAAVLVVIVPIAALALASACDRHTAGRTAAEGSAGEGSGPAEGSASAAPTSTGRAEDAVAEVRIAASPSMSDRGVRIAAGRPPVQLHVRVLDAERNELATRVVWHSLDPERVEVDALGRLSALGPLGPAFVTASAGQVIAEPMPVYVVSADQLPPVEEGSGAGDDTGAVPGDAPAADGRSPQ